MTEPTIQCPECQADIPLSETLAAAHIDAERELHRKAMAELKSSYESKAQAIAEREGALEEASQQLKEKLESERKMITQQIEQTVRKDMNTQLVSAEQRLAEKDEKLKQAEVLELESRKLMADAEEKSRQTELDVQRRIDEERKILAKNSVTREEALKKELADREAALVTTEKQIADKLSTERSKLAEQIRAEIDNDVSTRIADTEQRLAEKDKRLKEAEALELESRKRMADADEKLRQSDLEVQRKLDTERAGIREQTQKESNEEAQRKITEKDQVIDQMTKRIEVLHRQADSKSQQLQGDLEEVSISTKLREHFPQDELVRTPRGKNGADILLKVKAPSGKLVGTVLIEVKNTQSFDRNWVAKLKTDSQIQNADIGVIVSRAMPTDIELLGQRDDIWICKAEVLVPLLTALRNEILHVSRVRSTTALSESSRDVVFGYLTSADFTRRVSTMVDGYTGMRSSLDKQKRQFNQRMAEQERSLDKMIDGLSGVYGDLSHRVGTALKPVEGLELDDTIDDDPALLQLAETAN